LQIIKLVLFLKKILLTQIENLGASGLDMKKNNENNPNEKWYKFNDTSVEEIYLNETTLMGIDF
jgi:hypothetical protein